MFVGASIPCQLKDSKQINNLWISGCFQWDPEFGVKLFPICENWDSEIMELKSSLRYNKKCGRLAVDTIWHVYLLILDLSMVS